MSKKSSTFAPAFEKKVIFLTIRRKSISDKACLKPFWAEAASPDWRETALGAIAQLVEQRTENPCVTGSIPVGTTKKETHKSLFFVPIGNLTRGLISHTVLERLLLTAILDSRWHHKKRDSQEPLFCANR